MDTDIIVVENTSDLGIKGHLSLTVVDTEWFTANKDSVELMLLPPDSAIVDRRSGDNVMCTVGLTALAAALVWSGLQDQAANLGLTAPTYLTPMYGAVGSGAGTPAASDIQLFSELARQTVGAGASTPATPSIDALTTWLFYYSSPASTWTVTEAGVFVNAFSSANSGTLLDHWAFSPSVTVSTSNTLILQASFSIAG
jgi:hypothetical protein